jgi:hypothetical protein
MKRIFQILTLAVCLMGLTACTVPLQQTHNTEIHASSLSVVKDSIIKAGQGRGWIMNAAPKNVINGKLINRDHEVEIRITYATNNYQIDYVSSKNMKAGAGKIHRKYETWLRNLDLDIQKQLAMTQAK